MVGLLVFVEGDGVLLSVGEGAVTLGDFLTATCLVTLLGVAFFWAALPLASCPVSSFLIVVGGLVE